MFKNKILYLFLLLYLILSILWQIYNYPIYYKFISPIFWLIIIIITIYYYHKHKLNFTKNKMYSYLAILISIFYCLINLYLGLFTGYSKSPFNHDILAVIKNIIETITPIVGIELSRSFLLHTHKNNKLAIYLITLLMFLISLNFHTIFLISSKKELFTYFCSSVLPLFANNLLASYLSLKYSYSIPLILRIIEKLLFLIIPIFPITNWFIKGSFSLIITTIVYLFFNSISDEKRILKPKQKNSFILSKYALALFFSTILVCFMLGVFNYKPIAILSNSMNPTFNRGDIVVYQKLTEMEKNNLPINTIIVYQLEDKFIVHRITNIYNDNYEIKYSTKGDSNFGDDLQKVNPNQILGIYQFHIKYLGYPSIWLNELLN